MKTFIAIAILALTATSIAGPEPAPWWQQVEEMQGLLLKWITALSIIATALIGAIFSLWALFNSKLNDVRNRQDRASEEKRELQGKVVELAEKLPPNPPEKTK